MAGPTVTAFDVAERFWDLDKKGEDAITLDDWRGVVRLANELEEPDRGQQLQVATELGARLGFIPDGDANEAIGAALAAAGDA